MTLADLLNTLESADMLRIIKGGEEMFVGYLALFAPEVGHTNCTLYEQHKNDTVVKFRAVPEITCLLYTSPSPRDRTRSRMPSSA